MVRRVPWSRNRSEPLIPISPKALINAFVIFGITAFPYIDNLCEIRAMSSKKAEENRRRKAFPGGIAKKINNGLIKRRAHFQQKK